MKIILETERLRLRELVPEDIDFMAEMLADADVMRYYPRRLTRELSADWIARQIERYRTDGYGLWLAEQRAGEDAGKPVGQVGLVRQMVNGAEECEVGYLLHRPYWGHGFASEAALACRDYAFNTLGKRRVVSLIRPENRRSPGASAWRSWAMRRTAACSIWCLRWRLGARGWRLGAGVCALQHKVIYVNFFPCASSARPTSACASACATPWPSRSGMQTTDRSPSSATSSTTPRF
jgi:RimJ/RimL family protein N-acetyltransferase